MIRKEILLKTEGGNFVRLDLEFHGDRVSLAVPQEKDGAGHAEAVLAMNALSLELKEERSVHEPMYCDTQHGRLVDRISIKKKLF